ncbi:hypothetical protein IQ268_21520 [Oculatella sp. LEGE 06141]|uniref:hypothetical protein n=1 Tax=Oculatella sp. LEGE 06141 TaxID=1828648 RepID=UPI0018822A4B|nr:hypothetical protein [Oculatella sp. LEGE 06141]MBE9181144.1 hypothetical protein [Oculatella sp. LEGE 06141]
MEGWQQDWLKMLDTVAHEVEQLFREASQGMVEAIDALVEFSADVVEEIEAAVAPELDQLDPALDDWIEPILQLVLGLEASIDHAVEPVTRTVEPFLNDHPVCVGCRHYHGRVYGGTLLVCAMHPYGITDGADTCPDKEASQWGFMPPSDDEWG